MSHKTKEENRLIKYKQNLKTKSSVIAIIILSLITVLLQIFVQNGLNIFSYLGYGSSPLILLFNFLPVFLIMLFGYFAFNRIWAGYLLASIPLSLMLIANHYKIYFRDDPLKPIDFTIGNEAVGIISNYKLSFDVRLLLLILIVIITFLYLLIFINGGKSKLLTRVIGAFLSVSCFFVTYETVYKNKEFYDDIPSNANIYYDVSTYNYKGFVFSFLSNLDGIKYKTPLDYSEERVNELIKKYSVDITPVDELPNVIGIMSESFCDPRGSEKLQFYEGMNPLDNYDRLCKDASYGDIMVPGFAGGTSSTEFEFLTGMSIFEISSAMPTVYKTHISRDCFSLARMFKNYGYDTLAIHPGHSWFYNRSLAYPRMGFDKFISIDDLPDNLENVNFYTADSETTKLIIDNYNNHLKQSKNKYFNFVVTIQNHGPYMDYPTERPLRYVRPEGISDQLYYTINNYMDGLYDADKLLGEVADYLETLDEPTVLVFFGDHLPFFDDDFEGYKAIGKNVSNESIEGIETRYRIPYIIWANSAAKKQAEKNGREVKSGKNEDISSNFLATQMFRYIGVNPSPFFAFNAAVCDEISVINQFFYVQNGEIVNELDEEGRKLLSDYKILQYHYLKKYNIGEN